MILAVLAIAIGLTIRGGIKYRRSINEQITRPPD